MRKTVIIIPVLYRKHLAKSVTSVLANGCDVIIVNDSDRPLDMEKPGVTILDNKANRGVGYSRNRGVREALACGYNFIGFVDADSVLSKNWISEALKELKDPEVLGVSGVAINPNQKSRIARVKFVLKDYSRRKGIPFQIDCSLFRREALADTSFSLRRIGEDSDFLSRVNTKRLRVCEHAISYHHEVEFIQEFFWKELVGAMYSLSPPGRVAISFFLTPVTSLRMASLNHRYPDYPFAALVWPIRQLIWNLAYACGRLVRYGSATKAN